jgi:hypothetical protein
MRHRLTAAFVLEAAAEPGKDRTIYWDTTMPGFGLMVTRNTERSFVVQYRARGPQPSIDPRRRRALARRREA